MDTKTAFLNTTRTVARAFFELASYRVTGLTAKIAFITANTSNIDRSMDSQFQAVAELRKIESSQFIVFDTLFQESSIIFSYSWLDTYLAELEEILYLHSPISLGESIQIKLGKLLDSKDIESLVHDIARKKVRDKGAWSLKNRINDLMTSYGFQLSVKESDLEWLAEIRNNIVHNRRLSEFSANKKHVAYRSLATKNFLEDKVVLRFLGLAFSTLAQLYSDGARTIGITARFPKHRANLKFLAQVQKAFPIIEEEKIDS